MRSLVVLVTLAGSVAATDPQTRARAEAAAALALAAAPPPPAVAPPPKPAGVLDLKLATSEANRTGRPVVLYVGEDKAGAPRVPGAISAHVPADPRYAPGAVVVYYPSGGELWRERVLFAAGPRADLVEAVADAARKSPPPRRPLDWD